MDVVEVIAKRVLLTVAYSAKYGFPLSRDEIKRRLFFPIVLINHGRTKFSFRPFIPSSFQDLVRHIGRLDKSFKQNKTIELNYFPSKLIDLAIDRLILTKSLEFDGKYYRFFSRHPEQSPYSRPPELDLGSSKLGFRQLHVTDRQLNNTKSKQSLRLPNYLDRQHLLKWSRKKRLEAQPLIDYLASLFWVEGVAITGSLALNAADEKADADFLIVTRPNRLWLTRLLVLYFAIKHGKRRSFAHEEPNSWCFNLWLDTNHLFVPRTQHSLYTAYETCQADWVINRHQTAQKFLLANSWVRQTLPMYYIYRQKQVKKLEHFDHKQSLAGRILSPVVTVANWASYLLQLLYMLPHRTTERVGMGYAWFHPKK